jgi:hypothetical protein
MKTVDSDQFAAHAAEYLEASRTETIVVTAAGRPLALLRGLDYDDEQIELINSPEFWAMIEERRARPTIPWDEAKKKLESLDP